MQSIPGQRFYTYRPSARSRVTAIVLSLAICAGITIMLIWMGIIAPNTNQPRAKLEAVSFSTDPTRKVGGNQAARKAPPSLARIEVPEVTPPRQPLPVPTPSQVAPLALSQKAPDAVASFDLGKLPRGATAGGAAGAGQNSAAAYGPGEGPGGAKLYNAEWYREPSDAEIGGYLPRGNVRPEWAVIACRTVERYHVENCQELGESPRGSGLARAMRQAAWQFLVRPPRLDGKPVIGAWVRIRFDFKQRPNSEEPESGQD
jgi:protein TonB